MHLSYLAGLWRKQGSQLGNLFPFYKGMSLPWGTVLEKVSQGVLFANHIKHFCVNMVFGGRKDVCNCLLTELWFLVNLVNLLDKDYLDYEVTTG